MIDRTITTVLTFLTTVLTFLLGLFGGLVGGAIICGSYVVIAILLGAWPSDFAVLTVLRICLPLGGVIGFCIGAFCE